MAFFLKRTHISFLGSLLSLLFVISAFAIMPVATASPAGSSHALGNSVAQPSVGVDGIGSCSVNWATTSTCAITFKTNSANDVIIEAQDALVCGQTASSPTLTWQQRKSVGMLCENYAVWTGSGSITVTCSLGSARATKTCIAFGVSGANTAFVFDPNANMPCTNFASSCLVSTSNPNDMIIGFIGCESAYDNTGSCSPTSGYGSLIDLMTQNTCKGNTCASVGAEGNVVSTTQSNLNVGWSFKVNGVASTYEVIGDAIMEASTGPCGSGSGTNSLGVYAGYVFYCGQAETQSLVQVSGTFTVAAVSVSQKTNPACYSNLGQPNNQCALAQWIGMSPYEGGTGANCPYVPADGTDGCIAQAGTTSVIYSGGSKSYFAWYEFLPLPPVTCFAVNSGDSVSVTVTYDVSSSTPYEISLKDGSQVCSAAGTIPGGPPDYAQFITECPSSCSSPLPTFGSVTFTAQSVCIASMDCQNGNYFYQSGSYGLYLLLSGQISVGQVTSGSSWTESYVP